MGMRRGTVWWVVEVRKGMFYAYLAVILGGLAYFIVVGLLRM